MNAKEKESAGFCMFLGCMNSALFDHRTCKSCQEKIRHVPVNFWPLTDEMVERGEKRHPTAREKSAAGLCIFAGCIEKKSSSSPACASCCARYTGKPLSAWPETEAEKERREGRSE